MSEKITEKQMIKRIWWGILVVLGAFFVFGFRKIHELQNSVTQLDIIAFSAWIALLLFPLIQEINILGFSIKKDVENLRTEVKDRITDLKNDIRFISIQKQSLTQNFYAPSPTEEEISHIREEFPTPLDTETVREIPEAEISQDLGFLVYAYNILRGELMQIWVKLRGIAVEPDDHIELIMNVRGYFVKFPEQFDPIMYNASKIMLNICFRAINGQSITDDQISFVKDYYTSALTLFQRINSSIIPYSTRNETQDLDNTP